MGIIPAAPWKELENEIKPAIVIPSRTASTNHTGQIAFSRHGSRSRRPCPPITTVRASFLIVNQVSVKQNHEAVAEDTQTKTAFFNDIFFNPSKKLKVHEFILGHAFFCLLFRHRIVTMKLFSPEDNGTLGYVQHQYDPHSIYQRTGNFFIGTGPIWGGLFLLYVLSRLLLPQDMLSTGRNFRENLSGFFSYVLSMKAWGSLLFYVWLYASLTISAHITLSPTDIKGARDGGIALVIFIALACLLFGWCGNWEEYTALMLIRFFLQIFSADHADLFGAAAHRLDSEMPPGEIPLHPLMTRLPAGMRV